MHTKCTHCALVCCINLILTDNKYKKYWSGEVRRLFKELDGNEGLQESISFLLENSNLTEIFPNQIINSMKAAKDIRAGEKNIALFAPMQSGKSGTIYALCNYILPSLGLIKEGESIVFVTSMRDKDLFNQNKSNLEKDYFCPQDKVNKSSKIHVSKMNSFFKHPNPHKIINDLNVKLIVRDEDQYGCGQQSSFDSAFFMTLRSKMPNIKLLAVSATPYDILDAKFNGSEVSVINGERPQSYFGISEMLDLNLVDDYPDDFSTLVPDPKNNSKFLLHPILSQYLEHLNSFEDGIGIIRVSNTTNAIATRDKILEINDCDLDCLTIGSSQLNNYSIQEGLEEVKRRVLSGKRRVVLIVVQALSAGKDLKLLKSKVRFGVESRNTQLANGAQGIAGRLCGYHSNRSFKLLASIDLLQHYAYFEQDWEVFVDEDWRNQLYNQGVRGLSTQTRFHLKQRSGVFTPVNRVEYYSLEDLRKSKFREKLSFIDDSNYKKLLDCFEPNFYNSLTGSFRLNQEGVTIRLASSYKPTSNRVYRNWNKGIQDDFGNIFFKKNNYEYGILISNFNEEDERNKIGICGIKVFTSGIPHLALQETSVNNSSMYSVNEEITDRIIDSVVGMLTPISQNIKA